MKLSDRLRQNPNYNAWLAIQEAADELDRREAELADLKRWTTNGADDETIQELMKALEAWHETVQFDDASAEITDAVLNTYRAYRNARKPLVLEPDKPRIGQLTVLSNYGNYNVLEKGVELTPEVRAALKAAGIEVDK